MKTPWDRNICNIDCFQILMCRLLNLVRTMYVFNQTKCVIIYIFLKEGCFSDKHIGKRTFNNLQLEDGIAGIVMRRFHHTRFTRGNNQRNGCSRLHKLTNFKPKIIANLVHFCCTLINVYDYIMPYICIYVYMLHLY